MKVSSNWKLTFDPAGVPRVLLNYGDQMEGELRFPLRKSLEVVSLAEAAAPFLRLGAEAVVSFSFTVYSTAASDLLARRECLESLVAIAPLVRKPLRVEIAGTGTYWQFSNCAIAEHETGRELHGSLAKLIKTYQITATGLERVGA